jgi:PEP-CTERM motif
MLKMLGAPMLAITLLAAAGNAEAARYQFTLEGKARLASDACGETGYCEALPRLPQNSTFTTSFVIDDAFLAWDPDGLGWVYNRPIEALKIQLGSHVLSNFSAPDPASLWAWTNSEYGSDGLISISGSVTPPWSDSPANFWFDGYLLYEFQPFTLRANTPAGGGHTRLWIGPMDAYELNLEHLVISPVPEPSTWAYLISGFGLAGMSLRTARGRRRARLAPRLAS